LDFLFERTQLFAKTYNGPVEYIPYPSTWFNQERYNDDLATWRRIATTNRKLENMARPSRQFDRDDYRQPLSKF